MIRNTRYTIMLHRRYIILFTLLMTCLSVMGQVRDIVIKDGAYYSTASLPVDTVHNQSFEKDSIYLIVPRDAQIAYPDYNNRAQLIIWQSGRPIYALPITQYDSLSYVRMLQGDTLRTIFSQQAGSLPIYGKRPIVWQHGQVTVTDSAQVLANDVYQSVAQGNYANFIIQPTEIVRDTQYILCIRDTVYKVQDIYDDTDDVDSIPSVDTIPPTPGRRIGVFSVAADKQVSFSQGNLQYVQSADTWQFAENQLFYTGYRHFVNNVIADTVMYFGWSGKNSKAPWGISLSVELADYAGEFLDWGTNSISGDTANTWRTLSEAEWLYLCQRRKNAAQLLGLGVVDGKLGLIILPDNWVVPEGLTFEPNTNNASLNPYTLEQWNMMEKAGAVFIPPAGYFNHKLTNMRGVNEIGYYRGSTLADDGRQIYMLYKNSHITYSFSGNNDGNLFYAFPVRLVHDTIVPKVEPEYVDLGLSVKWATFNVGASKPEDYGDYFAWGETEPKEEYTWENYKWCDGTDANITKYNATDGLKTLLPEDDAAHVNWGGEWRMPTDAELQELIDNCTWEWDEINGTEGYYVTSNINNNHIFISAGGYKIGDGTSAINRNCQYWSNTLCNDLHAFVYHAYKSGSHVKKCTGSNRSAGQSVRPVLPTDRELLPPPSPSKRIGMFSVAKDKQVSFSQGNLQYTQSTDEWRFAREQYDYLGEGNLNDGQLANRIDLFGWSANNTTAPFGVSTSTDAADYAGEFVDWGVNTISGDAPNTWRTLSIAEWEYLLEKRPNAANLQGIAQVNGVNGLIILPDDWACPLGINFVHGFHSDFGIDYFAQHQQFTLDQWIILEQSGAVFLPASKWRNGSTFTNSSEGGHYWSSTCGEISTNAHYLSFGSQEAWMNSNSLHRCFAVRLVHDTIVPETIPDPCLVVKVNDTLSINMMCVEGGTMYIGRGDTVNRPYRQRPLRQVTISDFYLGQTEVTQELWLAIMGENPTYFPCDTCLCHPVDSVSIDEVLLFIERLNSLTGYNFRLPTEAEWEYAARGGVRSKGYAYAGSDNVNEVAWCRVGDSRGGTPHPVAQKRPNELGLYDMHGNLWEFVHDKFVDDINIYPSVNPTGPEGMRGSATGCGSAYYSALMPENTWGWVGTGGGRSRWFGFRLALSDQDPFVPITIGKYRFHMMYVQGGTFMMGSDAPDAEANEKPVHEVTLSDYYIGQTEVTQKLWKLVMGNNNNPSANKGDELPVTNITWDEAQVFVEKLSEMTGLHFRLPTEAEWEYAARGGQRSQGYTYAGSDDIDEVGWYNVNSANKTHNVGQKMPNELGIYDMTGNVWEWCAETFDENNDGQEDAALYGGAWDSQASTCRVISSRAIRAITYAVKFIGFRLVHDADFTQSPEPEYVDLGLSVKWATFNVGATSPEDYGDYFAWGETEPKEEYTWENYKWCDGTDANMTKYNATDGKTILELDDDAAYVNWGGKWRMPTEEEFTELREHCTWIWVEKNGINGYEITGSNGNSIFVPAAGFYYENGFNYGENGDYWSAEAGLLNNGIHLNFYPDKQIKSTSYRYFGFPIRPVYDDR